MSLQPDEQSSTRDSGAAALAILARWYGKPVDEAQLAHSVGRPEGAEMADLVRLARGLGFKARAVAADWPALERTPLPAVARAKDGRFFVIGKLTADGAVIQDPRAGAPTQATREAVERVWDGSLLLMTSRAEQAAGGTRFGLSWFIPALVRYRRLFGEVLLASFVLQLFGLTAPLFFQTVIDKVVVHRGLSSLDMLVLAMVAVGLFDAGLKMARSFVFSHTTTRIDVELGAKLFRHMLRLPLSYFATRRVGELAARVRELETVRSFLTGSALTLVIDVAFTIIFIIAMFLIAPGPAWIVVATLPAYAVVSLLLTPSMRGRIRDKVRLGAENQAFLVENVAGIETVKALALEPGMQRQWEEQLAAYARTSFSAGNLNQAGQTLIALVQRLGQAALLWFGARGVLDGDLTLGQLVAVNMLANQVSQPVLRLSHLWHEVQQVGLSISRLGDILNTRPEPGASAKTSRSRIEGQVRFEGVGFRYAPDQPPVLSGVSFDVPAGQVVGIVGPSGSGKSTLTRLIQRLYVPESGRVLIDGHDLALADPQWLRRQVGVVLQENFLFNRSIRDNIAIANPAASMEAVVRVAELAGAHRFISGLAEGYDTVLVERGASLSGGQRQRIAIARALLTDPRILIFDEATSALDAESEEVIRANMRSIAAGRTVFIIAHRLSAVRDCDRILTIEGGRVVEDGDHDALLSLGGRYAGLWRAQAAGARPVGAA